MRAGDARQRFQSDGMQSVSPERLVILLYERVGRDLATARSGIVDGNAELRHRNLLHAQEIVEELAYAVRPELWEAGERLVGLYVYILELLVKANIASDLHALDEAAGLVESLASAWREAYVALQEPDAGTA